MTIHWISRMSATPNNRLIELDALRGLAALSVVLFHLTIGYNDAFGWSAGHPLVNFPFTRAGVAIFL